MKNILVVVDESGATTHVLQAAVERAERERAALVVLNVVPEAVYERRQAAIQGIDELRRDGVTYTIDQATATASGVAERVAGVAIGERAIPYTSVGVVGLPARAVLAVAAAYDCADIMIAETKTRWLGRVGRFDRSLTTQFGGTVTRVAMPQPETAEPIQPVPEV